MIQKLKERIHWSANRTALVLVVIFSIVAIIIEVKLR